MELINTKGLNELISVVIDLTVEVMTNESQLKVELAWKDIPKETREFIINKLNSLSYLLKNEKDPFYKYRKVILNAKNVKIPHDMVLDFVKHMKDYGITVEGGAFDQDGQWLYIK